MPKIAIDFEWWRDSAGYRLLPTEAAKLGRPAKPVKHPVFGLMPPSLLFDREGNAPERPPRIVRRGGSLIPYHPMESVDNLFQIFAQVPQTEKGVYDFITHFGPLTEQGYEKDGQAVPDVLSQVRLMHDLLSRASEASSAFVELMGPEGARLTGVDVMLVGDPISSRLHLKMSPRSLIDAIWIQAGQALSEGLAISSCLHCGSWFSSGPGSRRRLDAKFCSLEHQVAFNSLLRRTRRAPDRHLKKRTKLKDGASRK